MHTYIRHLQLLSVEPIVLMHKVMVQINHLFQQAQVKVTQLLQIFAHQHKLQMVVLLKRIS